MSLAGRAVSKHEVLAIGDEVHTDIAGAAGFGIARRVRGERIACRRRIAAAKRVPKRSTAGISPSCLYRRRARPLATMRALAW